MSCNSSTSVCNCITDATNLVCLIVYGGSSICSMHFALCFALSIFVFYVCRISRRSTGAGGSSVVSAPRAFLVLDMCGSFLALAAEPRIKTNFYSSSYASCCNFASLAYISTLLVGVPLYNVVKRFSNRSSNSRYFYAHLSSIASMVSVFTTINYGRGAG